jgi:hypothetical protein
VSSPDWLPPVLPVGAERPDLVESSVSDWWDVDGMPLSTYAYAITTKGGTRLKPPPLRGTDVVIPYAEGQQDVGRIADSRTVTLSMWVIGADVDGRVVDEDAFLQNWRALLHLFWQPRRMITLTKRFRDGSRSVVASGLARYSDGLEPTMTGPMRADFTVDLFMADPYFYGEPEQQDLIVGNGEQQVLVAGDDWTTSITVAHDSGLTGLTLTNETTGSFFTHATAITAGDGVLIDVPTYTAQITPATTLKPYDDSARVTNPASPTPFFLDLANGRNLIKPTASRGDGSPVTLTWRPRYL